MAETTEELLIKIRADLSELKAGMASGAKVVKDGAAGMEQAYDKVRGKVSLLNQAYGQFQALLAATGIALVNRAVHNSLAYAESLKTVALRVGLTTDALQEWRYAAGQQGLAQETLDSALSKFNITLGKARTEGVAAAGMFQRLGLEVKNFANNDEALQAVIQRLREIKDPAQRASMAFQIFGREAGPKFAEFLTKSAEEFNKLRKEAHELGAVLDEETIEKSKKAQDQLAALSQITKTQATKALVDLAPVIIQVGNALAFSAEKLNEFIKGWQLLLGATDDPVIDPMAAQFAKLDKQIEATERRLKLMRQTMEERGQFTWFGADRQEAIDKVTEALERLRQKRQQLVEVSQAGIPLNINADYAKKQAEDVAQKLVELRADAEKVRQEIAQFGDEGGERKAAFVQLAREISMAESRLITLNARLAQLGAAKVAVPEAGGGDGLQRTEEENKKVEKLEVDLQNRLLQLRAAGAEAKMGYIRKTQTFTEENETKEIELLAQSFSIRKAMVDADAAARIETLGVLKLSEEERLAYEQQIHLAAETQKTQLTAQNEQARQDIRDAYAAERIKKTLEELRITDEAEANSRRIREEEALRERNGYLEWAGIHADNVSRLHNFEVLSTREKATAVAQITKDLASAFAGQSKRMFEVAKVASIAQTIMDTYAAAQGAYKAMAGIPYVGPALGVAAAAAAIASGIARVNAIKATTFGTKSVAGGGGGGSVPSMGGSGAGAGGGGGGPGGPTIFINMPAGKNFYSGDFIRDLIGRINEAQGDGARLVATS